MTTEEGCTKKEKYWKALVEECQTSPLSVKIFSEHKEVSSSTLRYWIRKYAKKAAPPTLMPVRVTPSSQPPAQGLRLRLPSGLEIQIGGGLASLKELLSWSALL